MLEKGRISALQMALLLYSTVLATVILQAPSIMAKHAERDMYLSPLWASFTGLLVIWMTIALHRRFPNRTVIEYSMDICGRLGGKVLGMVFLFFYLQINSLNLRQYGEFIEGSVLPRTPLLFIMGSMMLVCMFAVSGGIETVGRSAQMFVPVVVSLLMLVMLLLLPDLDILQVQPFMEKGLTPSLMGSISAQSWYSELFLMAFLLPYVSDSEKLTFRLSLYAFLGVLVTLVLTSLLSLMLFGSTVSRQLYPLMSAAEYISLAGFLQHVEALIVAIWISVMFIKISMIHYVLCLGTAQWLQLPNYRQVVIPLGLLTAVFAIWAAPNHQELAGFLGSAVPFYGLIVRVLLPLLLLAWAIASRKGKRPGRREMQP
ncbi:MULTISPECIES: GerAB/ArcD/ProY family transporter [Paenibacillus]|uniref:GerAB/ArcD/ProY family transporter n=1 Tax=Paenibacillus TaxID=44249 RepID=UPI0022B8904E|nr:endospore germination permease [Paenibacillus caseinilyticus]MCZ8522592.1 endospore germination permease [Paenibacillus caseinilyticus]